MKRILLLLLRPTIIRNDAEFAEVTEKSYNRAGARSGALASETDDQYPRADRIRLSARIPTLGAPFRPGAAPSSGEAPALMPPLPPRLRFDGE